MQETISDKKGNDGPKTTIDILEKTDIKKRDTQHQTGKVPGWKATNTTAAASNGDHLDEINESEQVAMEDENFRDDELETAKEKREKEKVKLTKDKNEVDLHNGGEVVSEEPSGNGLGTETDDTQKGEATIEANGELSGKSKSTPNQAQHDKHDNTSASGGGANTIDKKNGTATEAATDSGCPVMRGTLSLDLNGQRHLIRGMWNFENTNSLSAQRFELARNLDPDEDKTKLAVDGIFNGSFSLAYLHVTSKGKQKERSKVIQETGVEIKFTPVDDKEGEYRVDGKGTNQFGAFRINGTATPCGIPGDPTFNIVLRRRYETPAVPLEPPKAAAPPNTDEITENSSKPSKNKKNNASATGVQATQSTTPAVASDPETGPLPEPTKSFPTGVVALRGNLYKEESTDLGMVEVIHRINGMWAAGLDLILADPQNIQGYCNRFEYEHKSSHPTQQFPVSGRYSGWFELSNEDGTRTRINERDVTLKFRLNNVGYHNIEGKGSNVFGKYTITGTLTLDNVITIFRVFQPRKIKTKSAVPGAENPSTAAPTPDPNRRPSLGLMADQKLKLEDVNPSIIDPTDKSGGEPYDSISPPPNGTYSAVSQGVLRLNEDGSHSCQGKWAVTREHLTNSVTSNFNFRLEPHHAESAMMAADGSNGVDNGEIRQFPLDSAMYKGSFQMKKGAGSRYQTIVDDQIVMKFRKNKSGSFNVYGTGINAIGEFNLLGTLVMSGKAGGQVELYRIYKLKPLENPPLEEDNNNDDVSTSVGALSGRPDTWSMPQPDISSSATTSILPAPSERGGLLRRESSRMSKLPSRLEEDDPTAQLARIMEKCAQVLKFIRERDMESGGYFREPVDPVQLGIPTYYQVIKEPMDLRTIQRKMDANEISSPEELMRLVRLVFENAMTFNIDPAHSVHQAARALLIKFNDKIKDVERLLQSIRRTHGVDDDGKGKKKKKDEKKRKRFGDEAKSQKRLRLEEAEAMTSANANAVAAIIAAAPSNAAATVTRVEFNLLLNLVQQLQQNLIQTHKALAELSSDSVEGTSTAVVETSRSTSPLSAQKAPPASVPKPTAVQTPAVEKKPAKRKIEETKPPENIATEEEVPPLTREDKEWLTEAIGELAEEHLLGVSQIIRETTSVGADEGEIEIDLDELDNKTQTKLMKFVQKFVKKSKPKPKKKMKSQPQAQHPKKQTEKPPPSKKPKSEAKPAPKPKAPATTESFFSFGGKDDSDTDSSSSEDEGDDNSEGAGNMNTSNDFKLSTALGDLHNDDDEDLESDGIAGDWAGISEPVSQSEQKDEDKDLDWAAAAREQAAASKARDADRKAREEKKKKEAEEANKKAMAEAAKRKEELLAKKAEDLEQQEREAERAREAAREQARAEARNVEQTVDLDAQREIMKQLDSSYLDNESTGGASPSSDFGF